MTKPIGRKDNIVVQKIEGETLVYDLEDNKAFCLNETSALVWELCDGKRVPTDIASEMGKRLKAFVSDEVVYLALDQLSKERLLYDLPDSFHGGLSRREVIRKIGFASAISLPIVSSVVAPRAAMAQSCDAPGASTCTTSAECCSGNCQSGSSQCCVAGAANGARDPGFVFCIPSAGVVCSDYQINCCSVSASLIGPSDGRCGTPTNVMCECDPFP